VTSVGLTAPSLFTVSGSPVTTSGTLALTYSGNALPLANGGTGATSASDARITLGGTTSGISLFTLTNSVTDKFIKVNSNNTITLLNAADTRTTIGAGTGSVSSVGMTVPTFLSVSGSPVTSSGTLAVSLSGVPLPVANGGTGGANEADARNNLGAACKSCTETLTGNKTFSGTVTLSSVSGTATSVIGRSSTGQVVGVTLGTGLSLASGTLTPSTGDGIITTNGYIGLDKKSSITVGTDFPSTSAQSSSDLTFSLTGVSVGQPVLLGVPDGSAPANTNYTAWVSATNTVKIRFNNYSASTVNPASGSFTITVLNL
jgi:hypothetical protein